MKNIFVLFLTGVSFFSQAVGAAEQKAVLRNTLSVHQGMMGDIQQQCFWSAGMVRKIDRDNGIVTIFHDAVVELGWPSMTMPFSVRDSELLARFQVGKKVAFQFVVEEKTSVIVNAR